MNDEVLLKTLMLLKSLALNYPILSEWGIEFPKMIVIVTTESAKLVSVLKNFRNEVKKNSDFRFLIHSNSDKISEFARNYSQDLADGSDTSNGLPIVITDNPIVGEGSNDKFYIFIEDKLNINHIDIGNLHSEPDELELIRKSITEYGSFTSSTEELCLFAASCFIRKGSNDLTSVEDYNALISSLIEKNEAAREKGNYTNVCIESLYEYQRINDFGSIYHKSEASTVGVGNNMFYDDNFLYIPESLFKEIISPIRRHASLYKIMEELEEDGLLVTDNSKGYTVKLNCGDTMGARPRVLRLDSSKLASPGRLSFMDICKMAKEK